MTDDSLEERLADLESGESASSQPSLEKRAGSVTDATSITLENRFWTVSVLVPQTRVLLEVVPAVGESSVGGSTVLFSLVGGVVAAEWFLRRFGPPITSALWGGFVAAILGIVGAFFGSAVVTGSSPPDSVTNIGFLVVSAVVTAHRIKRGNSRGIRRGGR